MKRMRCPSFYVEQDGTYTLDESYTAKTFVTGQSVEAAGATLLPNGDLVMKAGYNWNGPSGPAVDTANTLVPSGMHDGLYACITALDLVQVAENVLREKADKSYRDSLKTWGVPKWRKFMHFKGVRLFGWLHV